MTAAALPSSLSSLKPYGMDTSWTVVPSGRVALTRRLALGHSTLLRAGLDLPVAGEVRRVRCLDRQPVVPSVGVAEAQVRGQLAGVLHVGEPPARLDHLPAVEVSDHGRRQARRGGGHAGRRDAAGSIGAGGRGAGGRGPSAPARTPPLPQAASGPRRMTVAISAVLMAVSSVGGPPACGRPGASA